MDGSEAAEVIVDPAAEPVARLLLAHGAGAPMDSGFMNDMAAAIAGRGVEVVRFEFPYMAARRNHGKRRPPDRLEALVKAWDEVICRYSSDALPLFIGGKSMGGRIASVWATENTEANCRGVVCFGYPFHPPGKPDNLRIAHLSGCRIPLLIVQGERDPLGSRAEVTSYDLAGPIAVCWLVSADHNLKPLRRSGYNHRQHMDTAADAAVSFIRRAISVSAP